MTGLAFFDTNVLAYADDPSAPEKQARAIELFVQHLRVGAAVLSLQVMQEYFVVATRKLKLAPQLAQRKVEILATARIVLCASSDVIAAIELHRLTQISFWDAMIVQAARKAGASILYSEDFQTGAVHGGVRVINPFLAA